MKIGKITSYFSPKNNVNNSINKQDLTSFGVEKQNKTQLLSKEAVTALKNKFASNVSFSGYFRTVTVKDEGEYKELDVQADCYKVHHGTDGCFSHKIPLTPKLSGLGECWERTAFTAKIKGKEEGSFYIIKDNDEEKAVKRAIEKSDNFIEGSVVRGYWFSRDKNEVPKNEMNTYDYYYDGREEIHYSYKYIDVITGKECDPSNLYLNKCEDRKVSVYFTDPGEEVSKDIKREANYIVYAPEPPKPEQKLEPTPEPPKPEPPKKKTLLQRIFG